MNILNFINVIENWEYENLRNWISGPSTQEGWLYDWKAKIDLDSGSLRKSFCAFANTKGGLIFFGVDNKKRIKGVKEDYELRTKISRKINKNILPPIPVNNWDICSTIEIPSTELVIYILYVRPSLYFDKPHITENKIYLRGNGENTPINDGNTVRKLFLIERFQPEHIRQLEHELNNIKKWRFNPDLIDFMYLKQLKEYLEIRRSEGKEFGKLRDDLSKIVKLYEKIKEKLSIAIIGGENISTLDDNGLVEYNNQLHTLLNHFYKKFKEVHGQ